MNQYIWKETPGYRKSRYTPHRVCGGKGWRYPTHTHAENCELVCATQGSFLHVINGEHRIQAAGEIVLIRETDAHRLSGRHFTYTNVMFHRDWLTRLEAFTQFGGLSDTLLKPGPAPRALIPAGKRKAYEAALDQLLAHSATHHGRCLFAEFLLTMVVFHLAPPRDHEFPDSLPDWLRMALAWVLESRQAVPSLEDVVRRCGRSHEHVTREFTRHLGIPPTTYLTTLRLDRAAEALVTTNAKLSEIARAAGFDNESYFFRAFRRRMGMTPRTYRQRHGPYATPTDRPAGMAVTALKTFAGMS